MLLLKDVPSFEMTEVEKDAIGLNTMSSMLSN